jgi:peptidylamidoglycolate lyase
VTDGYGQNHIHRFTASGEYVSTINGNEGRTGAFNTPHAIWIDTRKREPELYIANRASGQGQVYSLEGEFKRSFG